MPLCSCFGGEPPSQTPPSKLANEGAATNTAKSVPNTAGEPRADSALQGGGKAEGDLARGAGEANATAGGVVDAPVAVSSVVVEEKAAVLDDPTAVSNVVLNSGWKMSNPEQNTDSNLEPQMQTLAELLRENLGEIKIVFQQLAGVSNTPTVALNEAAELLCKHLSVSHCSIVGYAEHCSVSILLASFGVGSSELESQPVMKGQNWGSQILLQHPLCLYYCVKTPEQAAALPDDFKDLYKVGVRSFLSVPVTMEHEVLGALTIGRDDEDGFDVDWWEPMLGCLSMGLLTYLKSEQTQQVCQLMRRLSGATNYVTQIHQLLVGAQHLLMGAANIRTACRLALLNRDVTDALIFEPDQKATQAMESTRPPAQGSPADPQIQVTEIALENTLLLDAVHKGKARFVSDCASYIQGCMKPATDIFISGKDMVSSIVVLPLIYQDQTFGGFYVTLDQTSNFQNIKDLLMGLVNIVCLVLRERLIDERDTIWDSVKGGTEEDTASMVSLESSISSRAVKVKRHCTGAILKVLQHEIRKTHAKSQEVEWMDELQLNEVAGKGGFGIVYRGMWKGSMAAVKVMYARQHERQIMKDALEMAVLTTISHPNIIQVYECFTDVVEDASGTNGPMTEGHINVRFRKLQPDEDTALATCNLLVMEFCDRATLRHAMKKGVFHKRLGSTSVAVDLSAIVQVLIEVAQAIQYLHSKKLIHCDIKPENVLLKSDSSKSILGFVTKLSDFGLAKLLRESCYIVNRSGSGTVTHLAPELFQVGSKITTAVDTFSFGIMMWEVYTGQRAYGGLGRDAIIDRVYKKKARPMFPQGVPPMYAALAKACWEDESSSRPTFVVILEKLAEMQQAFLAGNQASGAGNQASGAGNQATGAGTGASAGALSAK